MNLKKYTKAELISKLKNNKPTVNNTDNNKSTVNNTDNNSHNKKESSPNIQIKIVELFILIKRWIIRLAIIALIIKLFRKYLFLSKILRFLNWIIISIFGISFLDNFNLRAYILELKFIIATVTAYITTTQFYVYLRSMWLGLGFFKTSWAYRRELSPNEDFSRETTKEETSLRKSIRNPKINKWLDAEENKNINNHDSDNTKYYILLLLLGLGIAGYYYYGGDNPGIGGFIGIMQAFKNNINEFWSINKTVKDSIVTVKDFLRKKENNTFKLETNDLIKKLNLWYANKEDISNLNNEEIKFKWETYKILKTRIEQLKEKFQDEFKEMMNGHIRFFINTFLSMENNLRELFIHSFPEKERIDLLEQEGWSDGSNTPIAMSPEMYELSINQIPKAPPAPPISSEKSKGVNALFDEIKLGKSLKPTETVVKENVLKGKAILTENTEASSSKTTLDSNRTPTLTEALSAKFDKFNKATSGDDEYDPELNKNFWDDKSLVKDNLGEIIKVNQTPVEIDSSAKIRSVELPPEFPILNKIINKGINLDDLNNESIKSLNQENFKIKPDILIEKLKLLPNSNFKHSLITNNVNNNILNIIDQNPGIKRSEAIEKLISENPQNKDEIYSIVTLTMNDEINYLRNMATEKQRKKLDEVLLRDDLRELEILSDNKTIDKIKTIKSLNRSHSMLLQEIKEKRDKTVDTPHYDNTMNLFE